MTPAERETRGKALLDVVLLERHWSPAGHALATFAKRDRRELPLFSLDTGDLVTLYVEGLSSRDWPSGTVYERAPDTITVAFPAELGDWADETPSFQLHKSVNRVTYKRMLEALESVIETRGTRLARLRDISLGLEKAARDKDAAKSVKWFDEGLNDSQCSAVRAALEAKDISLVHGPPGTGKTRALVEIVRQAVARKQSVFVAAPSNTACDNALERLVAAGVNAIRLGHPARISESLREHTLDFKLALHPFAKEAADLEVKLRALYKRKDRYRDRRSPGYEAERDLRAEIAETKDVIRKLRVEVFSRVMKEAEVIVATPAGMQDRSIREKEFDLVVLDEATQATEPVTWIPLLRARRAVLAGDHFQLPPTVRCPEAEQKGLGVTLFERFHAVLGDESKVLLERQYRMNEAIMGFSSKKFYGGRLVADESVRTRTLADLRGVRDAAETREPLVFVDTAGKGFEEKLEQGSESRYNPEEAGLVGSLLDRLLELGVPPEEIAVISPYSAQVRFLSGKYPQKNLEIDSVDGFQGREKELVIVSLVRSNMEGEMGFLADTRRMNVAMTRARRKLVVVGDSATLSTLKFYKDFIQYATDAGAYKSAWEIDV